MGTLPDLLTALWGIYCTHVTQAITIGPSAYADLPGGRRHQEVTTPWFPVEGVLPGRALSEEGGVTDRTSGDFPLQIEPPVSPLLLNNPTPFTSALLLLEVMQNGSGLLSTNPPGGKSNIERGYGGTDRKLGNEGYVEDLAEGTAVLEGFGSRHQRGVGGETGERTDEGDWGTGAGGYLLGPLLPRKRRDARLAEVGGKGLERRQDKDGGSPSGRGRGRGRGRGKGKGKGRGRRRGRQGRRKGTEGPGISATTPGLRRGSVYSLANSSLSRGAGEAGGSREVALNSPLEDQLDPSSNGSVPTSTTATVTTYTTTITTKTVSAHSFRRRDSTSGSVRRVTPSGGVAAGINDDVTPSLPSDGLLNEQREVRRHEGDQRSLLKVEEGQQVVGGGPDAPHVTDLRTPSPPGAAPPKDDDRDVGSGSSSTSGSGAADPPARVPSGDVGPWGGDFGSGTSEEVGVGGGRASLPPGSPAAAATTTGAVPSTTAGGGSGRSRSPTSGVAPADAATSQKEEKEEDKADQRLDLTRGLPGDTDDDTDENQGHRLTDLHSESVTSATDGVVRGGRGGGGGGGEGGQVGPTVPAGYGTGVLRGREEEEEPQGGPGEGVGGGGEGGIRVTSTTSDGLTSSGNVTGPFSHPPAGATIATGAPAFFQSSPPSAVVPDRDDATHPQHTTTAAPTPPPTADRPLSPHLIVSTTKTPPTAAQVLITTAAAAAASKEYNNQEVTTEEQKSEQEGSEDRSPPPQGVLTPSRPPPSTPPLPQPRQELNVTSERPLRPDPTLARGQDPTASTATPSFITTTFSFGMEATIQCDGLVCYDVYGEASYNLTEDTNLTSHWGPGGAADEDDGAMHWEILLLLMVVLAGVTGNVLVCIAVTIERKLQNVTNYFLMSLAVADLFVSLIVMPCSIVHELMGYWPFGLVMCDLWQVLDVMMCTSSIMHMCTISLDRYIAIRHPLKNRNKSRTVVGVKIATVWFISLAIASPIIMLSLLDPANVLYNETCAIFNHYFLIYGSLAAFFIPLLIMLIAYSLTIHLLNTQAKLCAEKSKSGAPVIRRSISKRRRSHIPMLRPHRDRSRTPPVDKPSVNGLSIARKIQSHLDRNNAHPSETEPLHKECRNETDNSTANSSPALSMARLSRQCSGETGKSPRLQALVMKHSAAIKVASVLIAKGKETQNKKTMNTVKTERKAVKVLGTMFAIFVLSWGPFFSLNFAMGVCSSCAIDVALFKVFLWLGYVSSTLNPIIYTIFNKTFKRTFIRILQCKFYTRKLQRFSSVNQTNGGSIRVKYDATATTTAMAGTGSGRQSESMV